MVPWQYTVNALDYALKWRHLGHKGEESGGAKEDVEGDAAPLYINVRQ